MTHSNEMYAIATIIVFLLSVPVTIVVFEKIISKILVLAINFAIVLAILTNLNAKFPEKCKMWYLSKRNVTYSQLSYVIC